MAAEATRLERTLTQLESDDLEGDLSLETDNVDEDNPDGVRPKPVEKVGIPLATEATRVPKNKRKTADAQMTSTTSSLATVPNASTASAVPTAPTNALTASAVPTAPTNIAGDQATPYLYNSDPTWGDLDIDLQLPFGFDTTSFDHQTSTDSGFNLEFPTFSPDFSFDTCHTSSTFDIIAPNPAASVDASLFAQSQPSAALYSTLPQTAVSPRSIVPDNTSFPFSSTSFSMVAPASVPSSVQFQPNAALDSSLLQTAVSPHLDSVNNLAPPRTAVSPHLDSVNLNTYQPTVVPGHGDASQHIPAPSNASFQQVLAVSSDAPSPLPVQNDAPSQHAETSESTLSSLAVSEVPPNQADAAPDSRRSGRNPAPSKRQEQMNQIDGKAKNKTDTASARIEKENTPSVTPEWATASHDLLLKSDLGKDWKTCVQTWFELEQELGFGSQAGAKVDLLQ